MPLGTLRPSDRRKWLTVWGVALGCLGALDIWRMTKDDDTTLSASIRYVLRTDTPGGEALFLAALDVFAKHILHS